MLGVEAHAHKHRSGQFINRLAVVPARALRVVLFYDLLRVFDFRNDAPALIPERPNDETFRVLDKSFDLQGSVIPDLLRDIAPFGKVILERLGDFGGHLWNLKPGKALYGSPLGTARNVQITFD